MTTSGPCGRRIVVPAYSRQLVVPGCNTTPRVGFALAVGPQLDTAAVAYLMTNTVWVVSAGTEVVSVESGTAAPTNVAALPAGDAPASMVVDSLGNLLVSCTGGTGPDNYRLMLVTPSGTVTDTGLAAAGAIAIDNNGNVYYAADGSVNRLAAGNYSSPTAVFTASNLRSMCVKSGIIYYCDSTNSKVNAYTMSSGVTTALPFTGPWSNAAMFGIAVDSQNNIFVTDRLNYCVYRLTPSGAQSTFINLAASARQPRTIAVDAANNIFITTGTGNTVEQYSPNGALIQTLPFTNLNNVTGLAVKSTLTPLT